MTRSRNPRGAAAKTRAAIKRGAAADKATAKTKTAPSIAETLLAAGMRPRYGFEFTPEQRAEIDACREVNRSGRGWISCLALAVALKEKYQLPYSSRHLQNKIAALCPGGRWGT